MARINLLPWRQEERLRKNKEFNIVLGAAAILAILATLLTYAFFNSQLEAQNEANAMIETENARLDTVNKEIETLEQQREEMLARMKLIQDLQGKRSIPVRVWDDVARAIPSAMYLTKMTRVNDVITFEGFADNANVVSELVRNLDASQWLADTRIPRIQSKVEAYQKAATRPQAKDGTPRQPYPEDNYIAFTVTTVVKTEQPKEGDPNATADSSVPTDPNAAPVPADPNAVPVPTDPNAAPVPADPNAVPAQPVNATQQPVPVAQPAPTQPVTAPAPVAPAPTDAAPQPVAQPQAPAGGQ